MNILWICLVVFLVLALVGGYPGVIYPHTSYYPSGGAGALLLIILLILLLR